MTDHVREVSHRKAEDASMLLYEEYARDQQKKVLSQSIGNQGVQYDRAQQGAGPQGGGSEGPQSLRQMDPSKAEADRNPSRAENNIKKPDGTDSKVPGQGRGREEEQQQPGWWDRVKRKSGSDN